MALKRDSNDYWSAVQAIAYIGFDALDPSRDWKLINPTEDQRAMIVAAVSELLAQVEAERLAPDWNGEKDEYGDAPELSYNARDRLVGKAMGFLSLSGDPFRNLQFKKSDIQALWTVTTATNAAPATKTAPASAQDHANAKAKRRGPKPKKKTEVKAQMKADIESGKTTVAKLREEGGEVLAAEYGVSRTWADTARAEVLAELSADKP